MKTSPAGSIRQAVINTPGAGYAAGDLCGVPGGDNGRIQVTAAIGTIPVSIKTHSVGKNYTNNIAVPVSGGSGAGLTVNISTVLIPTWNLHPGDGDLMQGSHTGLILRKRTIQHQSSATHKYAGPIWTNPDAQVMSRNNRNYLALLAHYWSNSLTAGQRLAWDAVALPGKNGFDAYMAVNKTAQGMVFSQPFAPVMPFTPPFAAATGFSPYVISALVTQTFHSGPPSDGCDLQIRFNIAPAFDSFSLLYPVQHGHLSTDPKRQRYQMERFVFVAPPTFTCCAFLAILLFGNLPQGRPITAFLRPWDSVSGITGDVYTPIIFPA
jgi:hypothetical protein